MYKRIFVIVIASCLSALLTGCRKQQLSTGDVGQTLDSLARKLVWTEHRLAEERWAEQTTGSADSLAFFEGLRKYLLSDAEAFSLFTRDGSRVEGEENRRRLELIGNFLRQGVVEYGRAIEPLKDTLTDAIEGAVTSLDGQRMTALELARAWQRDADRGRRESAWRLYGALGAGWAEQLEQLVRQRNRQAQANGYNGYFAMAFSGFPGDQVDYSKILQAVDSLTAGPYREALGALRANSPAGAAEFWDLAFYGTTSARMVDRYLNLDTLTDAVRSGLAGMGFEIERLPVYTQLTETPGGPPVVALMMVNPGKDVRMIADFGEGWLSARELLNGFGQSLYALQVTDSDALFRAIQEPAMASGMRQVMDYLCRDASWLTANTALPPAEAGRYAEASRRQTAIELRLMLFGAAFEYEVYRQPGRDVNGLYWELFEQYLDLPAHDELKPWALDKGFVTTPFQAQYDLLGAVIAGQTLAYLEATNGSVIGNPETRSFLVQNYFRFGSRYAWTDLLERGTGEKFNPGYLLTLVR